LWSVESIKYPCSAKSAIIFGVLLFSLAGAKGVGVWRDHHAEAVLDLDLPRVPIYYRDQMLGRTPLRITPELVREEKLPLDCSRPLKLDITGWVDCVLLTDGRNTLRLQAGLPPFFASKADTFETPWGTRSRMHCGLEEGNRRSGFVYPPPQLRNEPMFTIQLRDAQPLKMGSVLHLHCVLNNSTGSDFLGGEAVITPHYFHFDQEPRGWASLAPSLKGEATMPESWQRLAAGATLEADFDFDGPVAPGDYEYFCDWFLHAAGMGANTGHGSVYSNIVRIRVD
jgi:hypothetical protein